MACGNLHARLTPNDILNISTGPLRVNTENASIPRRLTSPSRAVMMDVVRTVSAPDPSIAVRQGRVIVKGRLLILPISLLGLIVGCAGAGYREPARRVTPAGSWAPPRPRTFVYPEDPPVANAEAIDQLLDAYRRQGRVVLVDVWSIGNPASRSRFDAMVDLHASRRPSGLQIVAAAFDNPGQWTPAIAPFLRSGRCGYPCAVVPPSAQSGVAASLGHEWRGQVPAVIVLDRDGKLAGELIGETPFAQIEALVDDVLAGRHQPIELAEGPGNRTLARARTLDLSAGKTVARADSKGASLDDVGAMAGAIAERFEATIEWSNARVAVLPFIVAGGPDPEQAGKDLADAVARVLSARHPGTIVDRAEVDAALARHKLTPLGIEYDPTVLSGKVNWTHIVTGSLGTK